MYNQSDAKNVNARFFFFIVKCLFLWCIPTHYGGKLNTGIFCCKPLVFCKNWSKIQRKFWFSMSCCYFLTAFLVWGQSVVTLLLFGEKIEQFSKTCHQQMLNLPWNAHPQFLTWENWKKKHRQQRQYFMTFPKNELRAHSNTWGNVSWLWDQINHLAFSPLQGEPSILAAHAHHV
jgi:hypothetical protein